MHVLDPGPCVFVNTKVRVNIARKQDVYVTDDECDAQREPKA